MAQPLAKKQETTEDDAGVQAVALGSKCWQQTRYQRWVQEGQATQPRLGLAFVQLSLCSVLHPRLGACSECMLASTRARAAPPRMYSTVHAVLQCIVVQST